MKFGKAKPDKSGPIAIVNYSLNAGPSIEKSDEPVSALESSFVFTKGTKNPPYNERLQIFNLFIKIPGIRNLILCMGGVVVFIVVGYAFLVFAKPLLKKIDFGYLHLKPITIPNPFVHPAYDYTPLYIMGWVILAGMIGFIIFVLAKALQGYLSWRNSRWIVNEISIEYRVRGVPFLLKSRTSTLDVGAIDNITIEEGRVTKALFNYGTIFISLIDRPGKVDDIFLEIPFVKDPHHFIRAAGKEPKESKESS
jgi:hypothetical protein